MAHFSKTSKLDGIPSWSLPALTHCPGAREKGGLIVEVCRGCYAREGCYHFPSTKAVRESNVLDYKQDDWEDRVIAKLEGEEYFRWFDSGDVDTPVLAAKLHRIVKATPDTKHWIPTRSHKFKRIDRHLRLIDEEPNACVRISSDNIGVPIVEYVAGARRPSSVVIKNANDVPDGATVCNSYKTKPAKCNGCRACWDKTVETIAYPIHGKRIMRVISEQPHPKK